MKRSHVTLAVALSALSVFTLTVKPALSQIQVLPAFVRLQATSPGAAQAGHLNIGGTAIAGQFKGDGSLLTNLDAGAIALGVLSPALGGTGIDSSVTPAGSLMFTQAPGTWDTLPAGGDSQVLTLVGGLPVWSDPSGGLALPYSGISDVPNPNAVFKVANSNGSDGTALWGETAGTAGIGVFGTATASTGNAYGGQFTSSSTSGRGLLGEAIATTGLAIGGRFVSMSTDGRGVWSTANAVTGVTYGGYFESMSPTGRGVLGYASSNTGSNYGGQFASASSGGTGVLGYTTAGTGLNFGGQFVSASIDGRGVQGFASASNGVSYGGFFQSLSPSGRGIYGNAQADTGATIGVYGEVFSSAGVGVYGQASQQLSGGTGVYGLTLAVLGGYGVYGDKESGIGGYGVYSHGALGASGTKAFRIDDPSDPENKYLLHYCSEGPEPLNVYQGHVTTGADGYAWVALPDYFGEINRDPEYLLTVVDTSADFVLAKVTRKVKANRFQIRTSKPGVEVSWEIKAVRNDRWVQKYGAPVETEKFGSEKGKYQHPELYGKPASMGMNFDPKRRTSGENRGDRP